MDIKRGSSIFSLNNIMKAFSMATLNLKRESQLIETATNGILGADTGYLYDCYGAESKVKDTINQNKCTQDQFVRVWVPDDICKTFSSAFNKAKTTEIKITDDFRRRICAGHGDVSTKNFIKELDRPMMVYQRIKEHISEVLNVHVASVLCFLFDTNCVSDNFSRVKAFSKTRKGMEKYKVIYPCFVDSILETLLLDIEKIKENPRFKCGLYDRIIDKKTNSETSIERLAKITLFALIFDKEVTDELCDRVYRALYGLDMSQEISRDTIESAGRLWYMNTRKEGHRFAKLIPNLDLLPLAGTLPIQVYGDDMNVRPLMEALNQNAEHLFLIGEGGIGKTTALYSIMQEAYTSSGTMCHQVPLYIELSKARSPQDFDLTEGAPSSFFIRNSIQRQLQASTNSRQDLLPEIMNLFSQEKGKKEYVLLLDGLNEVSREKIEGQSIISMLTAEIQYIMTSCANVRVILTSRIKEESLGGKIQQIYLSGISQDTIEKYLADRDIPEARRTRALNNGQLIKLLKVPLFLILYAELEGDDYLSRGEILHAFFTKRNPGQYSAKNRIHEINDGVKGETGIDTTSGITPEMLSFMLDFLLPEIAWDMVQKNRFQIDEDQIREIIKDVLEDKTDTSVCGRYGKRCFENNTHTIAKSITTLFGKDEDDTDEKWDEISSKLCVCFKSQLGVLQMNSPFEYGFIHHHIRDYFAALHHINKLKLSVYIFENVNADKARELLKEWEMKAIPTQVLTFIGEALGENHNIPRYDSASRTWRGIGQRAKDKCDRNLIQRAFDIYRNRFDGVDGYAVWNLFQILKLTRKDLSEADFSNLDLSSCRAMGIRLGNSDFACHLSGALLNDNFFMNTGHTASITSIHFSKDASKLLTTSEDKTAKIWDVSTLQVIETLRGHDSGVYHGIISPDESYVLTASNDGVIKIWDFETYQEVKTLKCSGAVRSLEISPSGEYLAVIYEKISEDMHIKLWKMETYDELPQLNGLDSETYSAHFSPVTNKLIVSLLNNKAKVWDLQSNELLGELNGHTDSVLSARYNFDETRIITASSDSTAKIWDAEHYKEIQSLPHENGVCEACFHPKGDCCLTISYSDSISIWDLTYTEPKLLTDESLCASANARFSNDGRFVVLPSEESVNILNLQTINQEMKVANKITRAAILSCFSENSKYLATVTDIAEIKIWDTDCWDEVSAAGSWCDSFACASFSQNGDYAFTLNAGLAVNVWDLNTNRCVAEIKKPNQKSDCLYYSADDQFMSVVEGASIIVLDAASQEEYARVSSWLLSYVTNPIRDNNACLFDDDKKGRRSEKEFLINKQFAVNIEDYSITVLDDQSNSIPRVLKGHNSLPFHVIPIPNANQIWSFSCDGEIIIWDSVHCKPIKTLSEKDTISSIRLVDNEFYFIIAMTKHASVWSTKPLKRIARIEIGDSHLYDISFNSHKKQFLLSSSNRTYTIRDAKGKVLHTFYGVEGLNVLNVDVRNLNAKSSLSSKTKGILQDYGAIC